MNPEFYFIIFTGGPWIRQYLFVLRDRKGLLLHDLNPLAFQHRINEGLADRAVRILSVDGVFLAVDDVLHCLAPLSFLCEYIIAHKYPVVNTFSHLSM